MDWRKCNAHRTAATGRRAEPPLSELAAAYSGRVRSPSARQTLARCGAPLFPLISHNCLDLLNQHTGSAASARGGCVLGVAGEDRMEGGERRGSGAERWNLSESRGGHGQRTRNLPRRARSRPAHHLPTLQREGPRGPGGLDETFDPTKASSCGRAARVAR